jgi:hypothetical protein
MAVNIGDRVQMAWLRVFPSTYGLHSLDEKGHCHTRDCGDYVGRHRSKEAKP